MTPAPPPPPPAAPCPECGRPSLRPFDATGLCLRCAGAQILSQTLLEPAGPVALPPLTSGPARIGPYVVIHELGRGGMGIVYLAQHATLGRLVALKAIPSRGAATSDLEMRFLREAETIARLQHPHIVAVHDAGRDQGHAYFAMDYFEDGDLARRLRAQPFAPHEAATLMHSVADAVACSHAAGVLHRDLKPSNILLAGLKPSVADFGLAAELDHATGLTAHSIILGTPHYLAPEALSRGSAAHGVASDVYALGVLLHEMLTGRTPFAGASPAELPGLLARHQAPDLRLLAPQVPRDLATICAKCLEYEPSRRYATAAAVAADLQRFLTGEPISARPVSPGAQLLRWARRRPALAATWVLSATLALASLTAAVLINRERLRADREAAASSALAEFFGQDVLGQASSSNEPDRDPRLRIVLDRAAARISERFPNAPLGEATARLTFGKSYAGLGEYGRAEQHLRRAASLRQFHLGAKHPETLRTVTELADVLANLGRNVEAATLIRPTVAELVRTFGHEHPYTIAALVTEALVERGLGQHPQAEAVARRALSLASRTLGPGHELTRSARVLDAALLSSLGKLDEANALSVEAVEIATQVLGSNHSQTLSARVSLASMESDQGRAAAAEPALRLLHGQLAQQLGPDHPTTLRALSNLGTACSRLEKFAEAEATFTTLVAARRRVLGDEHPNTLAALKLLALAHGRTGHLAEAIDVMRELATTSGRSQGPNHLNTLNYLRNLAAMLQSARRYEEAVEPAQAAYIASLREFGPEGTSTLADGEVYGQALNFVGRHREAEPILRQVADVLLRTKPDHWRSHYVSGLVGRTLLLAGQPAEAEPMLRAAHAALLARVATLPPSRREAPALLAGHLAQAYTELNRPDEVRKWQALSVAKSPPVVPPTR